MQAVVSGKTQVYVAAAVENSIALMNQAISDMRGAGATVLESVNARDCALFGACSDPRIPDMPLSVQDAIEEMIVSGYESVTMHRRPPADFGPLPGEP